MTPPPEPQTYAVRLSAQANQDVLEATVRLAELTEDPVLAKHWSEELLTEIGTLATLPLRYAAVKRESQLLQRSLRRMVFRQNGRSGMAYHNFSSAMLHENHSPAPKPTPCSVTNKTDQDSRPGPF